jgi:hypothetical protein
MTKTYIIYDGRARQDIDAASVLDTADTFAEALEASRRCGPDSVIVEYDQAGKAGGSDPRNPRIVSTGNRRVSRA